MPYTPEVVDLAAKRAARAAARAAKREGRGDVLRLQYGDVLIAELEPEFALDVLEPLQDVNVDLALLVRQALVMMSATDQETSGMAAISYVVDVLAANPDLPKELIEAVKEMGRRLLGEAGYAAFVGMRPTPWDVADLISALVGWYGVGLGESSQPTTPSDGGTTSPTTSAPISDSTPASAGHLQEPLAA
ncbi:hypothetical protein ACFY05_32155 [Microtetraspora fusca]|uniref:Tail assembly chaperone n=1 Tax=Microtetraspora fusca TaxID=1997 RepID=A0ABW6VE60_MICFU